MPPASERERKEVKQMLILQDGQCDCCHKAFDWMDAVAQYSRVTCSRCGAHARLCSDCQRRSCSCGGRWQTAQGRALEKGTIIIH